VRWAKRCAASGRPDSIACRFSRQHHQRHRGDDLSTWDLLLPDIEQRPVEDFVKPALYLTPKQSLDQVLPLLRARADHMAIVVDEFGSAIGILSMEDIFEEVVGTVDSGYDFDTMKTRRVSIESLSDDTHLISGGRRSPS
jgi:putative hemolysin